jgi:hypothetical protein
VLPSRAFAVDPLAGFGQSVLHPQPSPLVFNGAGWVKKA